MIDSFMQPRWLRPASWARLPLLTLSRFASLAPLPWLLPWDAPWVSSMMVNLSLRLQKWCAMTQHMRDMSWKQFLDLRSLRWKGMWTLVMWPMPCWMSLWFAHIHTRWFLWEMVTFSFMMFPRSIACYKSLRCVLVWGPWEMGFVPLELSPWLRLIWTLRCCNSTLNTVQLNALWAMSLFPKPL